MDIVSYRKRVIEGELMIKRLTITLRKLTLVKVNSKSTKIIEEYLKSKNKRESAIFLFDDDGNRIFVYKKNGGWYYISYLDYVSRSSKKPYSNYSTELFDEIGRAYRLALHIEKDPESIRTLLIKKRKEIKAIG